jgi:hypothetical protein
MKNDIIKFRIVTRDWKGQYDRGSGKGMMLFATEDEIETGCDSFAQIYCNKIPKRKISGQEVYNAFEELDIGPVKGFGFEDCDDWEITMEDK